MGMSPSWRRPMRSESMSMLITRWPSSAREAAVTNPTYPAPTTVTRPAVVPFGLAMSPSILLQEALGPAGQAFRYLVPVGCIGQAPVFLRVGHEPYLREDNRDVRPIEAGYIMSGVESQVPGPRGGHQLLQDKPGGPAGRGGDVIRPPLNTLRVQNVYSAGAAVVGAVRVDTDVQVGSRLVGHACAVYVGEVYILRGAGHDHADTPGPQLFAAGPGYPRGHDPHLSGCRPLQHRPHTRGQPVGSRPVHPCPRGRLQQQRHQRSTRSVPGECSRVDG